MNIDPRSVMMGNPDAVRLAQSRADDPELRQLLHQAFLVMAWETPASNGQNDALLSARLDGAKRLIEIFLTLTDQKGVRKHNTTGLAPV